MKGARLAWARGLRVLVVGELRQLVRQDGQVLALGLVSLSGAGAPVGAMAVHDVVFRQQPVDGELGEEAVQELETVSLCGPETGLLLAVEGEVPPGLRLPGRRGSPADVHVVFPPGREGVEVWSTGEDHEEQENQVVSCLRWELQALQDAELEAHGVRVRPDAVFQLHHRPTPPRWLATPRWPIVDIQELSLAALGVLLMLGFCLDGVQRNRRSGWEESLAGVGASRLQIVLSQWLAHSLVVGAAMGLAALSALCVGLATELWLDLPSLLAALALVLATGAALQAAIAGARDLRAAQGRAISPLVFGFPLVLAGLFTGSPAVPLAGLVRVAAVGGSASEHLQAWLSTALFTVAMLALAAWPRARAAHGDPNTALSRHAQGRFGREAGILLLLTLWSTLVLPLSLLAHPIPAILLSQLVGMLGLALLMPRVLGLPVRATLGLQRPRWSGWLAGALAPLGTLPLALAVAAAQDGLVPWEWQQALEDFELQQHLKPIFTAGGGVLLWGTAPVCEELLFRGALMGLLLPRGHWRPGRVRTIAVVLGQALVFGAVHGPFQLLPATATGLMLGALVLRSGSLWPAVLAHALHNAVVLRFMEVDSTELVETPELLGLLALALLPVLWLAGRSGPVPSRPPSVA